MSVPKPTKADYIAVLRSRIENPSEAPDFESMSKPTLVEAAKNLNIKVALGDAERIAKQVVAPKKIVQKKVEVPTRHETREQWLREAYEVLNDHFIHIFDSEEEFSGKPFDIQISAGWPRQDRNGKVVGQCWPSASGKGTRNIFISPMLVEPVDVLSTLLHEMIHAHDDCAHQHKGAFRRVAKAVGFVGKPTQTPPGEELKDYLKTLSGRLGYYPHTKMSPAPKVKVQTTRMLKLECPKCGCIVRMTRKWLDESHAPTCGCGEKMEEDA